MPDKRIVFEQFHENGQLALRGMAAINEDGEMRPEGPQFRWYENGQKDSEGWAGFGIHPWRAWHENGQLSERGQFDGGLRWGHWQTFDDGGRPCEDAHFRGVWEGRVRLWTLTGMEVAFDTEAGLPVEGSGAGLVEGEPPRRVHCSSELVGVDEETGAQNFRIILQDEAGKPLELRSFTTLTFSILT